MTPTPRTAFCVRLNVLHWNSWGIQRFVKPPLADRSYCAELGNPAPAHWGNDYLAWRTNGLSLPAILMLGAMNRTTCKTGSSMGNTPIKTLRLGWIRVDYVGSWPSKFKFLNWERNIFQRYGHNNSTYLGRIELEFSSRTLCNFVFPISKRYDQLGYRFLLCLSLVRLAKSEHFWNLLRTSKLRYASIWPKHFSLCLVKQASKGLSISLVSLKLHMTSRDCRINTFYASFEPLLRIWISCWFI